MKYILRQNNSNANAFAYYWVKVKRDNYALDPMLSVKYLSFLVTLIIFYQLQVCSFPRPPLTQLHIMGHDIEILY